MRLPAFAKPGQPIAITGIAQSGVSGLSRVQYCVQSADAKTPQDDPYFETADWKDARILPLPDDWAPTAVTGDKTVPPPLGFDADTGKPTQWPMRFAVAHWAAALPKLPRGKHQVRCRTIDAAGHAQPMPRPFRKAGCNAIQTKTIEVVEA